MWTPLQDGKVEVGEGKASTPRRCRLLCRRQRLASNADGGANAESGDCLTPVKGIPAFLSADSSADGAVASSAAITCQTVKPVLGDDDTGVAPWRCLYNGGNEMC